MLQYIALHRFIYYQNNRSISGVEKLCRLYKYLGIDRFEDHDTARAKSCKYFILNVEEKNKCLKEIQENKTYSITELENLI